MADLNTNVRYIKGIGETRAKALEKLGVRTLRDLIGFFPRRYEDRSVIYPIAELPVGETACCRAMIAAVPTSRRIPGGRTVVKVRAVDETGTDFPVRELSWENHKEPAVMHETLLRTMAELPDTITTVLSVWSLF